MKEDCPGKQSEVHCSLHEYVSAKQPYLLQPLLSMHLPPFLQYRAQSPSIDSSPDSLKSLIKYSLT